MTTTSTRELRNVISFGGRSSLLLAIASLLGLIAFFWPFLLHADGTMNAAHSSDAPWIFVMLLPLLLAIVLAEVAEGALDTKAVALLGVLAACGTALRLPGGVTGFEPVSSLRCSVAPLLACSVASALTPPR